MAAATLFKRRSARDVLSVIVTAIVTGIILLAIWLAVAAILENLRFGTSTDQILDIVGHARELALRDAAFGQQPGEDVLARLIGVGLLTPEAGNAVRNPWNLEIKAVSVGGNRIQLETHAPTRDCRRTAQFFLTNAKELGLTNVTAHAGPADPPVTLYDAKDGPMPAGANSVGACGFMPTAYLSLFFGLR